MIFSRRPKFDVRRFGSRELRLRIARTHAVPKRSFSTHAPGRFKSLSAWLRRTRLWKGGLVVLGLLVFYFLFVSGFLLITDVTFAGNNRVGSEELMKVFDQATAGRLFFVRKNHYLFMTEGRLNKLFTSQSSEIRRVSSNRKFPQGLVVEVTERNPGWVLNSANRNFLIDDEGVVIREEQAAGLPAVVNLNNDEVKVGDLIPNPKLTPFILSMHRTWPSKINSAVTAIKITKIGSSDIQFDSSESWSVFFDISRSVVSQLNNLAIILTKQIPVKERGNLAYIDLRSDKWVYYCFKNTPCSHIEIPKENDEQ